MDLSILNVLFSLFIFSLFLILFLVSLIFIGFYILDKRQNQHAILRNYPLIGRLRYLFEHIGPELRQYLFDNDTEGKPFSRTDFLNIILPAKYLKSVTSFGSKRDFEKAGYYIKNTLFPKQMNELSVDNNKLTKTKKYSIKEEGLFSRKEDFEDDNVKPWLLTDEDAIVIGQNCKKPFITKSLIGMSGMSYGALGDNAISALSIGLGLSNSWMNTGEGGVSEHHLKGNVDLIMQIGPAFFGVRDLNGNLSIDKLKELAENDKIKAFEIKMGQGAKIRGGLLPAPKVTPNIAKTRGVEPYKTVESPNRNPEFNDIPSLIQFIEKVRNYTGKPVGIKIVIGGTDSIDELARYMKETGKGPDFITIDGGEGGSGASYSEMMDSMGLPIKSAIVIVDRTLKKYGVRKNVKLIASGKLFTADKIAIALGMGADLVSIARAFMITIGCIGAQRCTNNDCPVGVATTDPNLQKALVVEEKKYRVANYVSTLRYGLFALAAASGLDTPTKFDDNHVVFKDDAGKVKTLSNIFGDI